MCGYGKILLRCYRGTAGLSIEEQVARYAVAAQGIVEASQDIRIDTMDVKGITKSMV